MSAVDVGMTLLNEQIARTVAVTKERDQLRAALKYARRFLNHDDHDTAYVDAVLANTEKETPS